MKDLSSLIEDNELEFTSEFTDAIIQIKSILDTKGIVEVTLLNDGSLTFHFIL